jgi:HD-GYP domain-containing protein (c-di-GMP phosphodiesterase class II)
VALFVAGRSGSVHGGVLALPSPVPRSSLALVGPSERPLPITTIHLSDVVTGLSRALDMTEGHPQGHAARSCVIGLRLARMIGMPEADQHDLFYALLLKDAGCSSNAARVYQLFGGDDHVVKRAVWLTDWRRIRQKVGYGLGYIGRGEGWLRRLARMGHLAVAGPVAERAVFQVRCDRGAAIALDLGLSMATAAAIRCMDEHWDGGGLPDGVAGSAIPVGARVIGLAQVLEIFAQDLGHERAIDIARERSGRWFEPSLVEAAIALGRDAAFWRQLQTVDPSLLVARAEPGRRTLIVDEERLDGLAKAFASVIDANSPYPSDHSRRVADYASAIGMRLGFEGELLVRLRRAALLHDIGKLGVPNRILDKPGRLTAEEWQVVRQHPKHTLSILSSVPVFREFAFDAACHHEKLDGTGYHAGLLSRELSLTARVIAVADITDALSAERPYREPLDRREVCRILGEESNAGALCAESVAAATEILSGSAGLPGSGCGLPN